MERIFEGEEMSYRITVQPITGTSHIAFREVESYEVIDGFVTFKDSKTSKTKRFAVNNCEIEEEE